jgi:hypothetical protein
MVTAATWSRTAIQGEMSPGSPSQWAEEIRRGQMPALWSACAPPGVSHVQLFSGLHRAVANNGTVEMTESDAAPLLNAGWIKVDADDHASTGRDGVT